MTYFYSIQAKVLDNIIYPLVALLFAVALVIFLWGAIRYIWNGTDETARTGGRRHMIWGVMGMAVMLSALAIVTLIFNIVTGNGTSTGIGNEPVETPLILR